MGCSNACNVTEINPSDSEESEMLRSIKAQIRMFVAKLELETSARRQAELRKQIEKLKIKCRNLYSVKTDNVDVSVPVMKQFSFQPFKGNTNKFVLQDVKNQKIVGVAGLEALVMDCSNISMENASFKNSILLKNVECSEITVAANQIRLVGCKDVLLRVDTLTGVFLQDSTNIKIASLTKSIPKVCDFSSPITSKNYELIYQAEGGCDFKN